jgi:hypothetical protein
MGNEEAKESNPNSSSNRKDANQVDGAARLNPLDLTAKFEEAKGDITFT